MGLTCKAFLFAVAACGSGGSSSEAGDAGPTTTGGGGGGAAGTECSYEKPCAAGLDCIVKDQAQLRSPIRGTCEPVDPACTEGCDCSPSACLSRSVCASMGSGGSRNRLFGCFTKLLGENETCELGLGCKDGLYCLLPVEGGTGTCKPIPAGCNAESLCSCATIKEQCAPNVWQGCTGLGDVYFLRCRPPT